jgi:Cu-Zn family superoxide dismutase
MAKCICIIQGDSNSTAIGGVLRLSQTSEDSPVTIEGELRGLTPGKHGISVNTFGDRSTGSESCGAIYNPFGMSLHV